MQQKKSEPVVFGTDGAWIGMPAVDRPMAGAYMLGDYEIIMVWFEERPSWLHRTLMRLLLGWKWVEPVTPDAGGVLVRIIG